MIYSCDDPMTHILIKYATRKPYQEIPDMPGDAVYNPSYGCWMLHGMPLVKSPVFQDRPVTKKCDQETGEDQKGE